VTSAGGISAPEPIEPRHVVEGFHCGTEALDTWLVNHAVQSHTANASRTRVICRDGRVVGFYSLAAGGVDPEQAPRRVIKGLARHQVPVVVLTRFAVDLSAQRSGVGTKLLRNALLTVAEISDAVGVRALLVHAKDEDAKRWYQARAEFEESPADTLQLFLLFKDLRHALR